MTRRTDERAYRLTMMVMGSEIRVRTMVNNPIL
jgi:hypothetical protein